MPPTTIRIATTTKNTVKRGPLLCTGLPLSPLAIPSVVIPSLQKQFRHLLRDCGFRSHGAVPAPLQPSMDDRKHARYKKQCRHGGEQQATDHRAAQRRVLFAAFAQAD